MPSSQKKVTVRPDAVYESKAWRRRITWRSTLRKPTFEGITRPSGTLFSEEGLAHWTVSSNAPYPLSLITYP